MLTALSKATSAVATLILIFVSLPAGAAGPMDRHDEDLRTVPFVDVARYLGRWYQISRNPLPFEPLDCACTQQTLGLQNDGKVSVYNSCRDGGPNGELRDIRGTATNDDTSTNARYTVDFGLPFTGQYWIIGLDADYRWAVVSDPDRRSLYILSKTPTLADDLYQAAVAKAAEQTSTRHLRRTSHEGCSYPER